MNLTGYNKTNKTLIILGMHRSGTSLITNWLKNCGLEIGSVLLGPGIGNSQGHFEDVDFYNLHKEILRDNNLPDSGIIFNEDIKLKSDHIEKIKKVVENKNNLYSQWAWKEPRTCLFLDIYREILPEAYYLVIFRDYQFVVVSLIKRVFAEADIVYNTRKNFLSKFIWQKIRRKRVFKKFCHKYTDSYLRAWIFYNEEIIRNLKKISPEKYLVLNYTMLNNGDDNVASFLINDWHFSLNHSKFSEIYNKSLMSEPFDIELYIKDRELVEQAKQVSNSFGAFFKNI